MTRAPDPHGQAALLLCESLSLLLIEKKVLHKSQVIDAINGVIECKEEIAGVLESAAVSLVSIKLLRDIARSVAAAG